MTFLKKIFKWLFFLLLLLAGAVYGLLHYLQPDYNAQLKLSGVQKPVEVFFDSLAVPHIYAQSETDAYFALGYVHAQERLFQMDLLRRAGSGRLSEMLGEDALPTDKFFRTIGIRRTAERVCQKQLAMGNQPHITAMQAYLRGVNSYIEEGKRPIEYWVLMMSPEPFVIEDVYTIGGVLAVGFAEGFKTEPVVAQIRSQLGDKYLSSLSLTPVKGGHRIPTFGTLHGDSLKLDSLLSPSDSAQSIKKDSTGMALSNAVSKALENLPIPLWIGSNGWVISPKKTKSGKAILANDTHMGYSQPCVWFEASLEYPGFQFVGLHAAGIPFGLIGRNGKVAWGVTMFENDDVDFYRERVNPDNPNQIQENGQWKDLQIVNEVIKVKDKPDVNYTVRRSTRGPIISDLANQPWSKIEKEAISVWWIFDKVEATALQGWYKMAHARNMDEMREGAKLIDAPGINLMCADDQGNIAWWASGKLYQRPAHVNPQYVLDGSTGKDEPLQFLDFKYNPKSENPTWGYVYSANNEPDTMNGFLTPGYYFPSQRARDIVNALESRNDWTLPAIQEMQASSLSASKSDMARKLSALIPADVKGRSALHQAAAEGLRTWNGHHGIEANIPSLYYKTEYYAMKAMFVDEMGEDGFKALLSTTLLAHSFPQLLDSTQAPWWDNKLTPAVETASYIVGEAFDKAVREMESRFGNDVSEWRWEDMHFVEHPHLFGKVSPLLAKLFNVGPFGVSGGRETINNISFGLSNSADPKGVYMSHSGPAMRFSVEFTGINDAWNVLPTGQSGYFMSEHYDNQAKLYNAGRVRWQPLDRNGCTTTMIGKTMINPTK